jgi:pyruvate dehydrogenase E1 component alpha subunit
MPEESAAAPSGGQETKVVTESATKGGGKSATAGEELLGLSHNELRELMRLMILSRRFEEKCAESYQMGLIGGFCHLYMGQEAVAVGAISSLREDDYVISAYRDHAQALVRGMSPNAVMAELYGRVDGSSKGMGGSMHLFDREVNFLGGHAIVGGQMPIAVGLGYATRYREEDRVSLCFFGDAAVNIGSFHESLNMAAKWELPVIFLCENNSYGMGTDISDTAATAELMIRACSYEGVTGSAVDGMDVMAVRKTIQEAVDLAREEHRPSFVEARCYRYMGHSMADAPHGTYRTREEVEGWRHVDPVLSFRERLLEAGVLSSVEYEELDRKAIAVSESAADFAEKNPRPEPSAIYAHVYADAYPDDVRRRDAWRDELE